MWPSCSDTIALLQPLRRSRATDSPPPPLRSPVGRLARFAGMAQGPSRQVPCDGQSSGHPAFVEHRPSNRLSVSNREVEEQYEDIQTWSFNDGRVRAARITRGSAGRKRRRNHTVRGARVERFVSSRRCGGVPCDIETQSRDGSWLPPRRGAYSRAELEREPAVCPSTYSPGDSVSRRRSRAVAVRHARRFTQWISHRHATTYRGYRERG